jgi:hypothetical protein
MRACEAMELPIVLCPVSDTPMAGRACEQPTCACLRIHPSIAGKERCQSGDNLILEILKLQLHLLFNILLRLLLALQNSIPSKPHLVVNRARLFMLLAPDLVEITSIVELSLTSFAFDGLNVDM